MKLYALTLIERILMILVVCDKCGDQTSDLSIKGWRRLELSEMDQEGDTADEPDLLHLCHLCMREFNSLIGEENSKEAD